MAHKNRGRRHNFPLEHALFNEFQITFIKGRIGYIGKFTDKGNINGLGVKLKTSEQLDGIMYGNRIYT